MDAKGLTSETVGPAGDFARAVRAVEDLVALLTDESRAEGRVLHVGDVGRVVRRPEASER
jgi:hypothetical protein